MLSACPLWFSKYSIWVVWLPWVMMVLTVRSSVPKSVEEEEAGK